MKPRFGACLFAAAMLTGSSVKAEQLGLAGQGCFATPETYDAGDSEAAQGMVAAGTKVVQAIQNALELAAKTQMLGGSIDAAVPTYQPLTKLRSFKQHLDVYVNPTVSLETKTGRFVSAKAAADALNTLRMRPGEAADLWANSGALVGMLVDDRIVALTPDLAESMGVNYRDLIEGVVSSAQNPVASQECYQKYGYIFGNEGLELAKLSAVHGLDDAPAFITWGYRSTTLPESTAEKLI